MRTADGRVARGTALMGAADAGELLTLQRAAWVVEGRDAGTFDIPPLTEELPDVVADLTDPAWTVWGLREDGRLVGTVRTRVDADGSGAYVGRLGVVPDHQGEGLGAALLRFAEGSLPPGVRRLRLITGDASSGNLAFYPSQGWVLDPGADGPSGTVTFAKDRVS